jgi:hypothetical protein
MNIQKRYKSITDFIAEEMCFPISKGKFLSNSCGSKLPVKRGNALQHNILIRNHIKKDELSCWILKNPALFVQSAQPIGRDSFKKSLKNILSVHKIYD